MPITIPSPCINVNQQKSTIFCSVLFFAISFVSESILEFDSVSTLSANTIRRENKKRIFSTQKFDFEVKPGDTNV